MHDKKRQNSFLCAARLGFSPCSGELLSLEGVVDLVQKRQGHEEKRKAAPFQRPFQSMLLPHAVSLAGCCPLLQTVEGLLSLPCFLYPNRLSQGNSPKFQQFPFFLTLFSCLQMLSTYIFASMDQKGQGQPPKSQLRCTTFRAGWNFPLFRNC